ncbi:MAG: hypothetical protein SOU51_02430 [Collinsella sp.]|nr:hypothetical protein [Collinsella sp.]
MAMNSAVAAGAGADKLADPFSSLLVTDAAPGTGAEAVVSAEPRSRLGPVRLAKVSDGSGTPRGIRSRGRDGAAGSGMTRVVGAPGAECPTAGLEADASSRGMVAGFAAKRVPPLVAAAPPSPSTVDGDAALKRLPAGLASGEGAGGTSTVLLAK